MCFKIATEFLTVRTECIAYRWTYRIFSYICFFYGKLLKKVCLRYSPCMVENSVLIAYPIYSLFPALGPQCHHFVPQDIGIVL